MKRKSAFCLLAAVSFAAAATPAMAQDGYNSSTGVQGRCVSNCDVPAPNAPASPPPLDPRMYWIGVTATVEGDVTFIYPTGERVPASMAARTPIPLGARVVTGPNAKVRFLLFDETGFTVGPNSELVMDRFVYDPATDRRTQSTIKLLKGDFRFSTGKFAHGRANQLKVNTPVAALGIRGTVFEVLIDPGGSGYVMVEEGQVVAEEYDTSRLFELNPGQRLRFENFVILGVQ